MNNLIEAKDIWVDYMSRGGSSVRALERVSLSVKSGEWVAVRGESGAGKSTILAVVGAMLRPSRGSVYFDDRNVYALEDSARSNLRGREFGFLFQNDNLLSSFSIRENVELVASYCGRSLTSHEINRALDAVGLRERASHYPDELSGGERHRAAFARAVVHSPRLLLADEPTGNLDRRNASEIISLMRGFVRSGGTIVVVTHDDYMASSCGREFWLR